jgi:predicted metal-dependent HD superfamily phosphohydrolase
VFKIAVEIAERENITKHDTRLLAVAAVYHDSGYLVQSDGHELISCDIVRQYLPKFQYTPQEINTICELIIATQIPQEPKSILEEILCDADMDYLGREDFFPTGRLLFEELINLGKISNEIEWNDLQRNFLNQHRYFTETSKNRRDVFKQQNVAMLENKEKLNDEN